MYPQCPINKQWVTGVVFCSVWEEGVHICWGLKTTPFFQPSDGEDNRALCNWSNNGTLSQYKRPAMQRAGKLSPVTIRGFFMLLVLQFTLQLLIVRLPLKQCLVQPPAAFHNSMVKKQLPPS